MNLIDTCNQFLVNNKIKAKCLSAQIKGSSNIFALKAEDNFKLSKLSSYSREMMLHLKSYSLPDISLKEGLIHITTLAQPPIAPKLTDILSNKPQTNALTISLGTSFKGDEISIELDKNPHLLIGGSTGSGKSSILHNIIANLILNKFGTIYLVDTKSIEFNSYSYYSDKIKIITESQKYFDLLKYLISIMEKRYDLMKLHNLNPMNNIYFSPIILIIDEYADIVMQYKYNANCDLLCRLLQKCRAAGIYCILATQRPSINVINGTIKANFPARLACRVPSKIDSKIILDQNGAETLTGVGEAIISNYKYNFEKFKVSYSPIPQLLEFLKQKLSTLSN